LYVVLKEVAESLNEVIIKRSFTRKQKMELFRDQQFLGKTSFGKALKLKTKGYLFYI
jgi:hypothetical protein